MPGRLVLLASSSRVVPGLLSWPAWSALTSADAVLVAAPDHPLLPALDAAGCPVRVVEASSDDPAAEHAAAVVAELAGDDDDAAGTRSVVWVMSPDGDPGLAAAISAAAQGLGLPGDTEIDLVTGAWDLPGAHLLDLVTVMDRLRSPGGCPWDAKQTHRTLVEYLVEEAYETVEAIETDDDQALREELGDLLLQVVFHARIAEEHAEPWSVDDVADGIVDKLVARHPHVFGDGDATTAEQVEERWQAQKNAEKGRASVTDGVPLALPSLVLAAKLLGRSRDVAVPPVDPEVAALADAAVAGLRGDGDTASAYGDLLLALVVRARADRVDLDVALRSAARRYRTRVRAAEGLTDAG